MPENDKQELTAEQVVVSKEEYLKVAAEFKDKNTVMVHLPTGAIVRIRKMSAFQFLKFLAGSGGMGDSDILSDYQKMKGVTKEDGPMSVPENFKDKMVSLITDEEGAGFRDDVVNYVLVEPEGLTAADMHPDDRDSLLVEAIMFSGEDLERFKKNK